MSPDQIANYTGEQNISIDRMMSTSIHGIFGVPYQFMPSVDQRLQGTGIGRKYADKIMSRLPLLFLTPGKQDFMSEFSKGDRSATLGMMLSGGEGSIGELIDGYGKYYTFKFDYQTYYNYVNTMCWVVAKYLNIEDQEISIGGMSGPTKIGKVNWSKTKNDDFSTYFNAAENVVFYLDGLSSVSENFSNSTTESSLASTINGMSDQAKELKFILGGDKSALSGIIDGMGDLSESIGGALSSFGTNLAGGIVGGLLGSGVSTVLNGGKIVFPELWGDSSFDRSYSIDIKLRSPDHDSLSIYLNILVPYIHLLALVLPRGLDGTTDSETVDPNGYTSPFLVRAYCKGLFNIDMGMITGMSVTKGAECCWNDDGIPTQIDISIEIKDLYSVLFMTAIGDGLISHNSVKSVVTNTSMMDFLANMAGLNLGQMEMQRRWTMYKYLTGSYYGTFPSRVWTKVDQAISNVMDKLYNIT